MSTAQSPLDAAFDALVEGGLEEWKIPGLSVAVVDNEDTFSKVMRLERSLLPLIY
jgi:hypothetical protein